VWLQVARLWSRSAMARARGLLAAAARWASGAWAWSAGALVAFAGVLVALLVPGQRRRRRLARTLARAGIASAGIRLEVSGLDRLPPPPYVAASNHASYLDAILLAAALPADVVFVAKGEFRRQWWMRGLLGSVGTRFVERAEASRGVEDVRELVAATREGEALVMFPEGTFVRAPGLLPFRMGTFVLACETGVPVVPVGLQGSRAILPAGTWLPRRGTVSVAVGDPLPPMGTGWDAAVALRDACRAVIAKTCGDAA
jgi:1-acyl-sn-glycerol-3-phosphate acyltransferase